MPSSTDFDPKRSSLEISHLPRPTSPTSASDASPALTHKSALSTSNLEVDLSLSSALSALIDHLIGPLTRCYTPTVLSALRLHLTAALTELFSPSWDISHPHYGSGFRSLICDSAHGLPKPLKESAGEAGVGEDLWVRQLSKALDADVSDDVRRRAREWEAWCDPGTVIWRYGPWEWEEANDPIKAIREPMQIIWQAATSPKLAPPRPVSITHAPTPNHARIHAIPIRAPVPLPAVFAIPPTPGMAPETAHVPTSDLLPAPFSRSPSPVHSEVSSGYSSSTCHSDSFVSAQGTSQTSIDPADLAKPPSRGSHRGSGSGSTSSIESDNSGPPQPITPDTRPPSMEAFSSQMFPGSKSGAGETTIGDSLDGMTRGRDTSPTTPRAEDHSPGSTPTPAVTPYDGGNVTVLGGGIKLGGMSRPGSRTPHDRSRSPSVSLASRALSSAMGPGGRKVRTRRRIMPTYLGHVGQPGVGGPVMGAFGMGSIPPGGWPSTGAPAGTGLGVGVGVGPPPVGARGMGGGMPRMGS